MDIETKEDRQYKLNHQKCHELLNSLNPEDMEFVLVKYEKGVFSYYDSGFISLKFKKWLVEANPTVNIHGQSKTSNFMNQTIFYDNLDMFWNDLSASFISNFDPKTCFRSIPKCLAELYITFEKNSNL